MMKSCPKIIEDVEDFPGIWRRKQVSFFTLSKFFLMSVLEIEALRNGVTELNGGFGYIGTLCAPYKGHSLECLAPVSGWCENSIFISIVGWG